MSELTTNEAAGQGNPSSAPRGAWVSARRRLGQGFVGLLALAAAAGGGYLEGEKIGAARAVAREVITRDHKELKEVQAAIVSAKQVLSKLQDQQRFIVRSDLRTNDSQTPEGAASSQGAPASAVQGAAPLDLANPPASLPAPTHDGTKAKKAPAEASPPSAGAPESNAEAPRP